MDFTSTHPTIQTNKFTLKFFHVSDANVGISSKNNDVCWFLNEAVTIIILDQSEQEHKILYSIAKLYVFSILLLYFCEVNII